MTGLKEQSAAGRDFENIISSIIVEALNLESTWGTLGIETTHCLSSRRSPIGQQPRTVANYKHKILILQKTRAMHGISFTNDKLQFYQYVTSNVEKKRLNVFTS